MFGAQVLALAALLSSFTSAVPVPQGPTIDWPDVPNMPAMPAMPQLPPPQLPPPIPVPKDGYTLLQLNIDVKPMGDKLSETVTFAFLDDTDLDNRLTVTPSGSCSLTIVEGEAKPTSNFKCSPSQYVAVHNQVGSLRGDGAAGSTQNFVMNMFAESFANQYIFNPGLPIFNHSDIACTALVPPFNCHLNNTAGLPFRKAGT